MNAFQKQLKLGDEYIDELAGQDRDRVSVEEFKATQLRLRTDVARCVAKTGRYLRHLYKNDICVRCGTPRRGGV